MGKRFLAMVLTLAMVLGICVVSGVSAATVQQNGLVFDLDLTGFDEAYQFVNNNEPTTLDATGNTTRFYPFRSTSGDKQGWPEVGGFDSANGRTKYISFVKYDPETKQDLSTNNIALRANNQAVMNLNEMTVEYWAKKDGLDDTKCDRPFKFATTNENANSGYFELMIYNNEFRLRPFGSNDYCVYARGTSQFDEQWVHYAITKKWIPAATEDGFGAWEIKTYANGELIQSGSQPEDADHKKIEQATDNGNLYIGGDGLTGGLRGSIGEFRVYNRILSNADVKNNYNAEVLNYTTLADTLELTNQPTTLNHASGELTLEFNNVIDEATLNNSIALQNSDDTPVKGGVYAYFADAAQKTVKVKYGTLEKDTQYKLVISSNLSSKNGKAFTGQEIQLTSSKDIINEDFSGSDYVVGENPPTNNGITFKSDGVDNSSSNIWVREATGESENTIKYLEFVPTQLNKDTMSTISFKPEGTTVIEVKVKPSHTGENGSGAPRDVVRLFTDQGNMVLGRMSDTGIFSGISKDINENTDENFANEYSVDSSKTDEFGFFHMKYVIKTDKETGNFYFEAYNMLDDTMKPYKCIMNAKPVRSITGFVPTHIYPQQAAQLNDRTNLAMVKVYNAAIPEVMYDYLDTASNRI